MEKEYGKAGDDNVSWLKALGRADVMGTGHIDLNI